MIAQPLVMDEQIPMPTVPGAVTPINEQLVDPMGAQRQQDTTGGLRFDSGSMLGDLAGAPPRQQDAATPTARPGQVAVEPSVGRVRDEVTPGRITTDAVSGRLAARTPYDTVIDQLLAPPVQTTPVDPLQLPGTAPAPDEQAAQGAPAATPAPEPTPEDRRKFSERLEDLRREMLGLPPIDRSEDAQQPQRLDESGVPIIESDPAPRCASASAPPSSSARRRSTSTRSARCTDASIYNQYMREAERLLQQAARFDAEEAFTRAINRRPGDPIAAAGRINAQLGAAMYLSAAVNLRVLFSAHPEMAAVRFSNDLFLRDRRLDEVIGYLRDEAARDRPFAREAALLLAFIGNQRGDTREVINAFNVIDRINTVFPVGEDPLIELLNAGLARRARPVAPGNNPTTPRPARPRMTPDRLSITDFLTDGSLAAALRSDHLHHREDGPPPRRLQGRQVVVHTPDATRDAAAAQRWEVRDARPDDGPSRLASTAGLASSVRVTPAFVAPSPCRARPSARSSVDPPTPGLNAPSATPMSAASSR